MKANIFVSRLLILFFVFASVLVQDAIARDKTKSKALEKRRGHVESVIIGKFATELELTPKQSEQFFPIFGRFRTEVETLQRRHRETRIDLDQLSRQENADQARVNELLNQVEADQERGIALKREFLKDVSAFLTPQQVSRCSVLLDELPRRLQQMIHEKQGRRRGGR